MSRIVLLLAVPICAVAVFGYVLVTSSGNDRKSATTGVPASGANTPVPPAGNGAATPKNGMKPSPVSADPDPRPIRPPSPPPANVPTLKPEEMRARLEEVNRVFQGGNLDEIGETDLVFKSILKSVGPETLPVIEEFASNVSNHEQVRFLLLLHLKGLNTPESAAVVRRALNSPSDPMNEMMKKSLLEP